MISIVILAYNRSDEVLITIEKLKKLSSSCIYTMEIIVVDNASADDTSELLRAHHPEVVLVTKPVNNGIAGWNEGFKIAKYKYILVLDDDSHIESGLNEAIDYLEQHADIGILALQILPEKTVPEAELPADAWQHKQDIVGFIGCGAIIRRELFEKIGGYAEWIYLYTHEFEYALRCMDAGYRVNFFGQAIVIHRASTINRSSKRMRLYSARNEMAIIYKYFEKDRPKYIFRTLINNLKFIKKEGMASGWYILQGFFHFLKLSSKLQHTPVSTKVQQFYADQFWSARPVIRPKK
ncbi:glycosyltransferase family 2 protein [Pedobacter sp. MC2016-14]|uniref:glycosyltransferase family 2 protein n=1 Tax=Pedobacter sp. MC2016-14 TaxID=2897327 RepID=UPI001E5CEA63|nr:glycosyltransferase family 2 protein [Pedobacter sp. MC2016-14]MCD0486951.1 glycosyltransferase family 2 protein [Pedobacter sp. MC2016-14]